MGSGSQGGACELVDGGLRLDRDETDGPDLVRFRVTDQTLALNAESSAWDFDGDGAAEPAGFVAVLVRL